MKKILFVLLALTFSLTAANAAFVIGKVDVKRILESVKEGQTIKSKLQAILVKKQGILKTEESKIRAAQEAYKKQGLVMNDKAKAKKERELQMMVMELQKRSMEFQKELQGKEQQMMKPILVKLNKVIIDVSKSEGVDMTVEVRSTPIVYAKSEKDITAAVIKKYNKLNSK